MASNHKQVTMLVQEYRGILQQQTVVTNSRKYLLCYGIPFVIWFQQSNGLLTQEKVAFFDNKSSFCGVKCPLYIKVLLPATNKS